MIYIEQPPFLPWLGFCEALVVCDVVALLDDVQFSERNVQNRNRIKTSRGIEWITAPVQKNRKPIREIRLAQNYSAVSIRQSLRNALGRAPYWSDLEEVLVPNLSGHRWLLDLNLSLISSISVALGSKASINLTSSLPDSDCDDKDGRIQHICTHNNESVLWAGSGTKSYLDTRKLEESGMKIEWNSYNERHPKYRQLWAQQGFVANLSVVDAAANLGWPGVRSLLQHGWNKRLETSV